MRRISIVLTIFLTMCMSFSCKKGETQLEQEHIEAMLNDVEIQKAVEWVVLLPGLGCHGCIREGEYFLKEHLDNEGVFLVLTNIESLKILQHKLGIELGSFSNVYADKEDQYVLPTMNRVYPCIVHLENGRYRSHEFQSPMNSAAFEKLAANILIE